MAFLRERARVEEYISDPLDNIDVHISLTAREMYTILESLYQDSLQDPIAVFNVTTYLEERLIDHDLPVSIDEFESKYPHPENEQYKSIVLK